MSRNTRCQLQHCNTPFRQHSGQEGGKRSEERGGNGSSSSSNMSYMEQQRHGAVWMTSSDRSLQSLRSTLPLLISSIHPHHYGNWLAGWPLQSDFCHAASHVWVWNGGCAADAVYIKQCSTKLAQQPCWFLPAAILDCGQFSCHQPTTPVSPHM